MPLLTDVFALLKRSDQLSEVSEDIDKIKGMWIDDVFAGTLDGNNLLKVIGMRCIYCD